MKTYAYLNLCAEFLIIYKKTEWNKELTHAIYTNLCIHFAMHELTAFYILKM